MAKSKRRYRVGQYYLGRWQQDIVFTKKWHARAYHWFLNHSINHSGVWHTQNDVKGK